MNNRLNKTIEEMKKKKKKALVVFLTAGYPTLSATEEMVLLLEKNGVDIIEIGVPFSDPVADGLTIQFASQQALKHGISLKDVFALVRRIRLKSNIPIILMGYMNPFHRMGFEKTVISAFESGVDGFIAADLIPEEASEFKMQCDRKGISLMFLAAPNTRKERLSLIDHSNGSFNYLVSLTGVTGGRKQFPASIKKYLMTAARQMKIHPNFVGFGISGPEQIRHIKSHVDGVIVGSAIIDIIRKNTSWKKTKSQLAAFVRSLRHALDKD